MASRPPTGAGGGNQTAGERLLLRRVGHRFYPMPDRRGADGRAGLYLGPSSVLVTLKLASTLTVTLVPSALVMWAS